MMNPSESVGPSPQDPWSSEATRPSWNWLRNRISDSATAELDQWLEDELETLESNFAALITEKSRKRALRCDLNEDRSRCG